MAMRLSTPGTPRLKGQPLVTVGSSQAGSTPAIQQDEIVEHDLDAGMPFAGGRIVPPQRMEPASNVDAAAFGDILRADLGQRAPRHAAGPFSRFLHLAVRILPPLAGGHSERGARGA